MVRKVLLAILASFLIGLWITGGDIALTLVVTLVGAIIILAFIVVFQVDEESKRDSLVEEKNQQFMGKGGSKIQEDFGPHHRNNSQ